MSDVNVVYCRILLRTVREEAAKRHITIPKNLTALKVGGSKSNWWLVTGGSISQEITAFNAYDAKVQVIEGLMKQQDDRLKDQLAAFEFGFQCHEKGMNLQAAMAEFYKVNA